MRTGTPPDGQSFVTFAEAHQSDAAIHDAIMGWRAKGMNNTRVVACEIRKGWWIEVWRERPAQAAPHCPPRLESIAA